MERIKEIYNYRQMIFRLVRKDLRGRYKGSVLGFFWTFLNPLLQLLVYTMVFSVIMRSGIDKYYLFLLQYYQLTSAIPLLHVHQNMLI